MASVQKPLNQSPSSSETQIPTETHKAPTKLRNLESNESYTKQEEYDSIDYPPPWKHEKFFVGGYSQSRMIKFKKPKTMYTAINLFAGVAIMFYGYGKMFHLTNLKSKC